MAVTNNVQQQKGIFLARVLANEPVCAEHWRFVLGVDDFPSADPGQFLQIRCADPAEDELGGVLLRRPFSIGGLRRRGRQCELTILHRVVGPGTRWLSRLKPGQPVSIIGPLGHPFHVVEDRPIALLVGGGVGLPPVMWLAQVLARAGRQTLAFCGARTGDLLPLTRDPGVRITGADPTSTFREFADCGVPVVLATDDGSLGAAGMIPEVFARYADENPDQVRSAAVYSCGPEPMMHAVARICHEADIPCQVCLERMMACGTGACQSCVVRVRDETAEPGWRYRLCCTDGPVFDSRDVLWDG